MRTKSLFAVVALLLLQACSIDGIRLQNDTGFELTHYKVVTTPPPPHREADEANVIAPGGRGKIDPQGFHPIYYTDAVVGKDEANGVQIQFTGAGDDPQTVLVRVMHFRTAPGQEGSEPDKQPIQLHEEVKEVEGNVLITVTKLDANGVWAVAITP